MAALALGFSAPAGADTSLSGLIYSRVNADLRQESPHEDNREWRNKFFLELKSDTSENTRAVFSLLAEHDTLSGQRTRAEYNLGLYEGFVRIRSGDFDFHLGKQIVDWSKGDVTVIDTLNPRNIQEFIAREDEFVKIPVLMARATYTLSDDTFEAAYIPFYVPSRFDLYGSDWSFLNNKSLGSYEGDIDVGLYSKQGFKPGVDDYPEANAVNGTFGARWDHKTDNFDFQLSFVNGWEVLPLFKFNQDFAEYLAAQPEGARKTLESLSPQEVLIYSPLYRARPIRQNQIGFGTSGSLGDSTVRGELSVVHPQELYTTKFELTEHTVVSSTAGIDRFLPWNLYANVSYLGAYIAQYPDEGLFLMREFNHFGVGVVRGSYFDDKFAPEFRAMVNLEQGDYMFNPRLPVKVAENTQLTLGAFLLNGTLDTIFGQLRENKFAYLQLKYSF